MSHDELLHHYRSGYEAERFGAGSGLVERARTQEIILRFLPAVPLVVLDIGGGAGAHAIWLLERGHSVHLVDPMPVHVEEARAVMAGKAKAEWSATVGDARDLARADASADAVLLLGPLYHLTDRGDRIDALTEAYRVVRPGGFVFAGAISRFASLLDGMARDLLDDPVFHPIVDRDLAEGQHRNPTRHPDYFTTAFFHRPEELHDEVREAGFDVERVCGLEGPTSILPNVGERWADEKRRRLWLDLLARVESEPSLLGLSAHLLAVGRKPGPVL